MLYSGANSKTMRAGSIDPDEGTHYDSAPDKKGQQR